MRQESGGEGLGLGSVKETGFEAEPSSSSFWHLPCVLMRPWGGWRSVELNKSLRFMPCPTDAEQRPEDVSRGWQLGCAYLMFKTHSNPLK